MKVVYKTADSQEIFHQASLAETFLNPENVFSEKRAHTEIGPSVIDHLGMCFQHVMLWHGKMCLREDLDLTADVELPVAQMIFSLDANVLYENYSGQNEVFSFSPNQHNIVFTSSVKGKVNRKAVNSAEQFEIILHPEFLLRYLPVLQVFDTFRSAVLQKNFAFFSPYNMPVTVEMKLLLKDILNCQKNPALKRIYVEAKIIELLMLQLEQYEQISGNVICSTLRKADVQKMHEVKSIIDSNWKEPCSLIDLAQLVTTNEYNLKKSFKEVFGTTIFGYVNDVKMTEAKRLLLSGEMNIGEVSDIVGYKNANHFTTAFKRHFGFVPSDLK